MHCVSVMATAVCGSGNETKPRCYMRLPTWDVSARGRQLGRLYAADWKVKVKTFSVTVNSAPMLLSRFATIFDGESYVTDEGGNPNFFHQPHKQPKKLVKGIPLSHFASLPTTVHLREGGGEAPEAHQLLVAVAVDVQKQ